MKTASLVLGILGLCLCWVPVIGVTMSLLAAIFGAIKVKTGMGVAGLVLGVVGIVFGVILTITVLNSIYS